MDQQVLEKLEGLPRLARENRQTIPCKVCGSPAYFFDVVDFNKSCSQPELYPFGASGISVHYFRCPVCCFLFTDFFDHWTPAEFARFVYNEDYIKVDGEYAGIRSEREATSMARRLAGLSHLKILDYGSGAGHFADLLRSHGFENVSSFDPFSSPIRPEDKYELITCFEVLEHTTSPHATLSDVANLLDPQGCVIFSTGIQPQNIGEMRANWWYVAPRNGHVSIYTLNGLARLARAMGLSLYTGAGGSAFAGLDVSAESRQILSSVGRPLHFVQLTAPGHGFALPAEQKECWHEIEGTGAVSFRWTRETEIQWRVQSQPFSSCELEIAIPILNEVQPGFADRCQLVVGSSSVSLARNVGLLTGSLEIKGTTEAVVKLVMPPLLRPCDLRAVADIRPLGLAISVGPPVQPI